jgi:hypothetical protein
MATAVVLNSGAALEADSVLSSSTSQESTRLLSTADDKPVVLVDAAESNKNMSKAHDLAMKEIDIV